jgi:hypothetical protein
MFPYQIIPKNLTLILSTQLKSIRYTPKGTKKPELQNSGFFMPLSTFPLEKPNQAYPVVFTLIS